MMNRYIPFKFVEVDKKQIWPLTGRCVQEIHRGNYKLYWDYLDHIGLVDDKKTGYFKDSHGTLFKLDLPNERLIEV